MSKFVLTALAVLGVTAATADPASEDKVRAAIQSMVPSAKIDAIAESSLPGFYEVVIGSNVLYASADGKFLMQGRVFDIEHKVDLTERRESSLHKVAMAKVGTDKRIVFAAKHPTHTVSVFTDIDCGYCRRLHQQIGEYNDLGISVEYLFFPRAGLGSASFDKAVTVWCAKDRNKAMTDAKAGVAMDQVSCQNPVAETFQLGQVVGVSGTPTIVAENGTLIGGYVPPAALLERLNAIAAQGAGAP